MKALLVIWVLHYNNGVYTHSTVEYTKDFQTYKECLEEGLRVAGPTIDKSYQCIRFD